MTADFATNDQTLFERDIRELENQTELERFFARLGYNIDDAINVPLNQLGLDTEALRYQISSIRRLGEDPIDGEIVIYLMVVRSLTVNLRQKIANAFRERPEQPLLILTVNYDELDFVLIEREQAPTKQVGRTLRQILRPRSLTVNRQNPSHIALRVLRRFTFTEEDAIYQTEKISSAYTLAEWSEEYFNNRALFSDYYLNERLRDTQITPAWEEDVRPIGRIVHGLLTNARSKFTSQPEQIVRRDLYEPLFGELGLDFLGNKAGDTQKQDADYFLYLPNQDDKPIAAALTYVWNRNLDDVDFQRDQETPEENPGAMVVTILEDPQMPDWVIVTNGKLWRLYSATAANKATNYYEVDLEEAVTAPAGNDQLTALKYWWLFFRAEAFTGFLDHLRDASQDFAKELGDRLKERVFTQIFPQFATGFIKTGSDETELDEVYQATLTFLYRLMFILYAESLDLLPLHETRGYQAASLDKLKKEIAAHAGTIADEAPQKLREAYSTTSTALYERLQTLFTAIDTGDANLNLPTYNGGLFNAQTETGRFLAQYAIPDQYLALGLNMLCRDIDQKRQDLVFIDYKSLGVRQLGSIYEGLLEFKLKIASETLAVVKEKGKEVYKPLHKAGKRRVLETLHQGDVYLENDKQERKATGSYYTPDYIVKYIVEHTVGPVLERKFAALEPRLREASRQFHAHQKRVAQRGHDQPVALFWNEKDLRQLADDCLNVRVLDPAMGSGHFLVEVQDFVSNKLINFLNGWSQNPVWGMLDNTKRDILDDMQRQSVTIDESKLNRVTLLKRSVLKRCVYGVDLNPMAVELAKVSLWLDAFTLGAPLSFLDHHLKCGNSLIGARIAEVQEALEHGPRTLFARNEFAGVMMATDLMRQVSFLGDNTVAQVNESAAAYRSASDHLAPFKRMLDVYTSQWFGNTQPKQQKTNHVLQFLRSDETEAWLKDPSGTPLKKDFIDKPHIAATALEAAQEKRFFHWELEFPEVFFAPSKSSGQDVQLLEGGGFDAIVGNPPWGADLTVKPYFQQAMVSCRASLIDSYGLFVEQAVNLSKANGYFTYIIPDTFLRKEDFLLLRHVLLKNVKIHRICETGPVFEDVPDTWCSIIAMENTQPDISHQITHYQISRFIVSAKDRLDKFAKLNWARVSKTIQQNWLNHDNHVIGYLASTDEQLLITKILAKSAPLKSHTMSFRVSRGEEGSKDSLESKTKSSWKILVPEDVNRYEISNGRNANPSKLSSSKKEKYYTQPKVWIIRIQKLRWKQRIVSSLDVRTNSASMKTLQIIISQKNRLEDLYFLTTLLNSQVINFWCTNFLVDDMNQTYLENLPIPIAIEPNPLPTNVLQNFQDKHNNQVRAHTIVQDIVNNISDAQQRNYLYYYLVNLSQKMHQLNKEKIEHTERFLTWLENILSIEPYKGKEGIDTFNGKTIVWNFLGDYQKSESELAWSEFEYRLHQNRARYSANLEEVKPLIQQAYEASLAILRPLKEQLAYTDTLIDKIVYQLYGLTEEEIRLIEQPQYEQALTDAKQDVLADKALQKKSADEQIEAIAEKILPAAKRFQQRVEPKAEEARLKAQLSNWHTLPADTRTMLLTGEYNIQYLPDHLDFSTSVISHAKAVESTLYERIFKAFRADGRYTDADCRNKFLQGFMREERHLTIGSMQIILQSSRETALRQFISSFLTDTESMVTVLADEAMRDLRNEAAHDTVLTKADAQQTRQWAVDVLGYL